MINDVLQIIGVGQCGTRLGLEFEKLGVDCFYVNSDEIDIRGLSIDSNRLLLLGKSGTGGNPKRGKELLQKNWNKFTDFVDKSLNPNKMVFLIAGLGGGTGGSVAPLMLDYLISEKQFTTGCLATLPPRMLGILAADNALRTLKLLKDLDIKMFVLADNEFLIEEIGLSDIWWKKVNRFIVTCITSAFDLLQPGKISQFGIGSIDMEEIMRIIKYGNGLIDIRTIYLNSIDLREDNLDLVNKIFEPALIEGYSYNNTLAYLIGIDLPRKKNLTQQAKRIFDITKKTCGSAIARLGMFVDPALSEVVRVTIINAGLKLPRVLQTRINNLKRDEERFKQKKSKEEIINLTFLEDGILD